MGQLILITGSNCIAVPIHSAEKKHCAIFKESNCCTKPGSWTIYLVSICDSLQDLCCPVCAFNVMDLDIIACLECCAKSIKGFTPSRREPNLHLWSVWQGLCLHRPDAALAHNLFYGPSDITRYSYQLKQLIDLLRSVLTQCAAISWFIICIARMVLCVMYCKLFILCSKEKDYWIGI